MSCLNPESRWAERWAALERLAAQDLGAVRRIEPHLDALAILRQAGLPTPDPSTTWGVYAAEAPGHRLEATPLAAAQSKPARTHLLTGVKAWCSLAGSLTNAVVTAHVDGGRRAFAVDLRHPGVTVVESAWPSRGLAEIPSGPVRFESVPAEPVGGVDWYLTRPGFAWGGIGVAACWFGGALGMARRARAAARTGSPIKAALIGQIDAAISVCRLALADAAAQADSGDMPGADSWALALRVRNTVHDGAQRIQTLSRELAGPALLTGDEAFAKADADLTVYLSQHHGLADHAALGTSVLERGTAW
jgi:hypothetical protein